MQLQYTLELFGTFVFAISGVMAMHKHDHDWFGASFTGFITAIGGGTIRDLMLG
ncbi:MAG TPA: TRIC cation channel family protein, partial [Cyclobacteriaceae bacterium]|nr:TRIC cation channel family protein [Cyclobacteriaceae bacterium]